MIHFKRQVDQTKFSSKVRKMVSKQIKRSLKNLSFVINIIYLVFNNSHIILHNKKFYHSKYE